MVGVSGDSMSLLALIETTKAKYSEVEGPSRIIACAWAMKWNGQFRLNKCILPKCRDIRFYTALTRHSVTGPKDV